MSIKDGKITLLNYNNFTITIPTETRTYILDPAQDEDTPTIINVSYNDIEFINSHSNAFKTGLIAFKSESQEELYTELAIFDWENILTNKEIKSIVLNPTINGLQKIVDITDTVTFERVRGILTMLLNTNSYDISNRVIKLINERYKELRRNIIKSQIIIQTRDTKPNKIENEEVADLKKQLEEMKNMMAQMVKNRSDESNKQADNSEIDTSKVDNISKKPVGRPSKK